MEVCRLSPEVMLLAGSTSIRPITGRLSLSPRCSARSLIGFPCGSLSQKGKLRVYHVSYICHERVRFRLSTDDPLSATRDREALVPVVCLFWLRPVSIFGLFRVTVFISNSHYINHASQPLLPTKLMLFVTLLSHDLRAVLANKATLFQWLLLSDCSDIRTGRVLVAEDEV